MGQIYANSWTGNAASCTRCLCETGVAVCVCGVIWSGGGVPTGRTLAIPNCKHCVQFLII